MCFARSCAANDSDSDGVDDLADACPLDATTTVVVDAFCQQQGVPSRRLLASVDEPVLQLNTSVSGQLDPGNAADVFDELELAALTQFVRPIGGGTPWQSPCASKDALLEPTIDVRLVFIVPAAAVPPSLESPVGSAELANLLGWVGQQFPASSGEVVPGDNRPPGDDEQQGPGPMNPSQRATIGISDHAIIAGSAVGGVVAVLAIAGGVWCHVVRRRWIQQRQDHSLKRKKLVRAATKRRRALRVSSSHGECVDDGNMARKTTAPSKLVPLRQKRREKVAPETAAVDGDSCGTNCKVLHESPARRPVAPKVNSWGLDQNTPADGKQDRERPVGVKQDRERPAHAPVQRSASYETRETELSGDDGIELQETHLGEVSQDSDSDEAQRAAAVQESLPQFVPGHSEDTTHHL